MSSGPCSGSNAWSDWQHSISEMASSRLLVVACPPREREIAGRSSFFPVESTLDFKFGTPAGSPDLFIGSVLGPAVPVSVYCY